MRRDIDSRLRNVNLNLLKTLRAVLNHRSVTKAAEELHLTQAAVSNNLRQLREHFNDDLVVRDGRNLRLTSRSSSMVAPLEAALDALDKVLATEQFNPAVSTQKFRVAAASNTAAILMPVLAGILAEEAPKVSLQFVTATATSPQDLLTDKIDLIVSPREIAIAVGLNPADPEKGVSVENLPSEKFVCLVNKDAEEFKNGLSKDVYLNQPHASFFLNLNIAASVEQSFIEANRIGQFDRMLTSDFTILPLIAATSNMIVLVPESLARLTISALPLRMLPCPFPVPDLELWSVWNRHRDNDDDLIWFRKLLLRGFDIFWASVT